MMRIVCQIPIKVKNYTKEKMKQKKGRTSIHFNGDSMNTEVLFPTVHSVNQLSVYGERIGVIKKMKRDEQFTSTTLGL